MLEKEAKIREIRDYLLGNINLEEEMTKIEEKLMTSDEYFQELQIEEEDLIQDYVDNLLTADDCRKFEERFLISKRRRQKVKMAYSLSRFISEQKKIEKQKKIGFLTNIKVFFPKPVLTAAAFLVIAGGGFFVYRGLFLNSSKNNQIVASLNKVLKKRPFDARITDFNYAPIGESDLRGEKEKESVTETNALEGARLFAEKAVRENRTAENLRNLGRVFLIEKNLDKAIQQFEEAQKLEPQNAQVLSDLAVSYFEKSKHFSPGGDDETQFDYGKKALNTVGSAIQVKPDLLEARFNKALFLQKMNSTDEARQAWQEYLKLDLNSPWAKEAEDHLKTLQK